MAKPNEFKNQEREAKEKFEAYREKVVQSELVARDWKAEYEKMYYTLEADKLRPAYDEYWNKVNEKRMKEIQERMEQATANQEQASTEPIMEPIEIGQ